MQDVINELQHEFDIIDGQIHEAVEVNTQNRRKITRKQMIFRFNKSK